jgi:hypothetical protein
VSAGVTSEAGCYVRSRPRAITRVVRPPQPGRAKLARLIEAFPGRPGARRSVTRPRRRPRASGTRAASCSRARRLAHRSGGGTPARAGRAARPTTCSSPHAWAAQGQRTSCSRQRGARKFARRRTCYSAAGAGTRERSSAIESVCSRCVARSLSPRAERLGRPWSDGLRLALKSSAPRVGGGGHRDAEPASAARQGMLGSSAMRMLTPPESGP